MTARTNIQDQLKKINERLTMHYVMNDEERYEETLEEYNKLVDSFNLTSDQKLDHKINEFEQERQRIASLTPEELEKEKLEKKLKDLDHQIRNNMCHAFSSYVEKYEDVHDHYVNKCNKLIDEYNRLSGTEKYKHIRNQFIDNDELD